MTTTNQTTATQAAIADAKKRKRILIGMTLLFIIVGIGFGIYYREVLTQREQTDDAYVGGNMITLTSQVSGNVQEIRADETQMVKAGAELIKLDPLDAELTLRLAEAKLGNTVRQLRQRYADIAQYDATIAQRKLLLQQAEDDLARRAPLAADHTLSAEEVTHARQTVTVAKAALEVAQSQADAARSSVSGVNLAEHPSVLAAQADFIQAWVATRRNAILAPASGYVAKRSVQIGAHITPGTALLAIVPMEQLWVDANFKESELQNLRVGQPVEIEADIYGGKVKYHGKLIGLSAGTGSAFSLLPAQNATGNWIKVVQRVPVRIALDPKELAEHPLRIGLSTLVTVDTHDRSGAVLGASMPATPVYTTQALNQPIAEAEALAKQIVVRNLGK
ncbi:MAG TPA: HlyD family efflux transporter periplasmic adaptor subunit [Burkholderiaceae bacterium]|jgi:membrane fusion protein (multidrug efflux system)|nr:HlyD family efflux transporter periplasmic adaptor subunit [Burkholderiaceae bacterium]